MAVKTKMKSSSIKQAGKEAAGLICKNKCETPVKELAAALTVDWRLAKSLEKLRAQINLLAPNRKKHSDGSVGDRNTVQGTQIIIRGLRIRQWVW